MQPPRQRKWKVELAKADAAKPERSKPAVKCRPYFVIEAVSLLVSDTAECKVGLGVLG
jgi:hypothetical protein